jgi:hypothetical protein
MLKGKPIDASSTVDAGSALTGEFKDALAFVNAAAETPGFATCMGTGCSATPPRMTRSWPQLVR